ncbi:hypothetical protein ACFV2H_34005 [Streptomyces sp. NPDC059629]|uniref:non-homologous end-joining DNA ligase LigD n=1 Tax=Streptomyces sp. NPDC059629 TaxID=3346889 RepID=UPI00369C0840
MNATTKGTVPVGRRRVPLPKPDKELFPDDGITKAELVDYYRAVARVMLPFLHDRPLVMVGRVRTSAQDAPSR